MKIIRYLFNKFSFFLFYPVITFFPASSKSQDTLYYSGNIIVSKKVSYKYNIRFVIHSDNTVLGYSLTDPGGMYETKNRISGKYDNKSNSIYFEESKVFRSKVDTAKNDLCFVHATLTFKKDNLFEKLDGKFIGVEHGKTTPCGKGEIKLINTQKAKTITQQALRINDAKSTETVDSKAKNNTGIINVHDENPKAFLFSSSDIKLKIWDNGKVDGDRISISMNGKYLFTDLTLDSTIKTLDIKIPDDIDARIVITALNEGTSPPNTAMIVIESPFEKYTIDMYAKTNEVRTIYLRKRR